MSACVVGAPDRGLRGGRFPQPLADSPPARPSSSSLELVNPRGKQARV